MALEIQRSQRPVVGLVSDRRLYLTADKSQVVEEGDARAASLFATPGWEISAGDVERYRLTSFDGVIAIDPPDLPEAPIAPTAPAPEPDPPVAPKPPEPPAPAEPARPAPATGRSKKGRSGGS